MKTERMPAKQFNLEFPTFFKTKNKGNKFGAKKMILDGKKFDSTSEGNLYAELMLQQRAGLIESVDCQAKEELWAYGVNIGNYYVDFKIKHLDGKIEFIEHKSSGTVTDLWRWKWKMLLAKYRDQIEKGEVVCNINWYKGYRIIKR